MDTDPQVERSLDLPVSPRKVWVYLTDGALLGEWFGGDVTIEPVEGGAVSFDDHRGGLRGGEVEQVEEERLLVWTWSDDERLSRVEFRLAPSEAGSRLTVLETLIPWEFDYLQPLLLHQQQTFNRGPMALV